MESGTENMDWIGAVLRRLIEFTERLIEFTEAGGEVNVVVTGINVGADGPETWTCGTLSRSRPASVRAYPT